MVTAGMAEDGDRMGGVDRVDGVDRGAGVDRVDRVPRDRYRDRLLVPTSLCQIPHHPSPTTDKAASVARSACPAATRPCLRLNRKDLPLARLSGHPGNNSRHDQSWLLLRARFPTVGGINQRGSRGSRASIPTGRRVSRFRVPKGSKMDPSLLTPRSKSTTERCRTPGEWHRLDKHVRVLLWGCLILCFVLEKT